MKKNLFLSLFTENLNKRFISSNANILSSKRILAYMYQINIYLQKKNLQNTTIILQLDNRLHTLIFYLAAIFSKTTICPLDPKLPKKRVFKIKKLVKANAVIKKINLVENDFYKLGIFNLKDHNFLITFSSGTSGTPKGIVHSSDNLLGSSFSYSQLAGYNNKTKILHCLPEFYMAGIINTFLACFFGLSQIIVVDSFSKKSIFTIWNDIKKFNINLVYLVPSIYSMLINFYPTYAKKVIKQNKIKFISTSNNLYPNIRKSFFKKFNVRLKSCYGITEMGGPLTHEIKGDLKNDSAGNLIKGVKIRIKKINGKNNLLFKSEFKCKHLIIAGLKKKINLDKFGYFNSQDTGYIKNREIILTGREKDILKKGGELIYLKDIENIIMNCPFVEETAAVSIDDELSDEKLNLYIVFKPKKINQKNLNYLVKVIQNKLYKTEKPDKVILIKRMTKTLSGKIVKRKLLATNASNKIREIIL